MLGLTRLLLAACGAALLGGAAAAQPVAIGALTVTGRYVVGPHIQSLSREVSYADLDLTTNPGRAILRARVADTAKDLCGRLREDVAPSGSSLPSCQAEAIASAAPAVREVIATARPRMLAFAAPAAGVDTAAIAPDRAPDALVFNYE